MTTSDNMTDEAWEAIEAAREAAALFDERSVTAAWLDQQIFPPLEWTVEGILPEGMGLLAAPPKAGKSWMAANIGLACAAGGSALSKIPVKQRPVLYLALEDGHRRLQSRLRTLTMGALRRVKDANNRYQLELLSGPGGIDQTAEQQTLWGVPVVQTTQQAAGTAAILSIQSGAAVVYVREALTTFYDPYSLASTNVFQFIAETRLALATPRPSAIALCSGLPTS